jgi:hypothetical protein
MHHTHHVGRSSVAANAAAMMTGKIVSSMRSGEPTNGKANPASR